MKDHEKSAPVVERQPSPKVGRFFPNGYSAVRQGDHSASVEWSGISMSFSEKEPDGRMGQLVDFLRTLIDEAPPELAELQATIAQLTADLASANADKEAYAQNAIDLRTRIERLKGGAKWQYEHGSVWWEFDAENVADNIATGTKIRLIDSAGTVLYQREASQPIPDTRPSHANAPANSGAHPHNDGLDDYRGKV